MIKNPPADAPFFAKIGFTEVHRPFTHGVADEKGVFIPGYLKDTPEIRRDLAEFQATIRYFDRRVGEIFKTLEESNFRENTLVVFTSDHGIPYPGAKWTVRRAGIAVPLILYQPGTCLQGGTVFPQLMSQVDVLPTLLDLLGLGIPDSIQGFSYRKLLEGKTDTAPRREVFSQYTPDMKRDNVSRSVFTERYHLIRYFSEGRTVAYPTDVSPKNFAAHVHRCRTTGKPRPFAQLFDLRNDLWELNDIGSEKQNASIVLRPFRPAAELDAKRKRPASERTGGHSVLPPGDCRLPKIMSVPLLSLFFYSIIDKKRVSYQSFNIFSQLQLAPFSWIGLQIHYLQLTKYFLVTSKNSLASFMTFCAVSSEIC